MASDQGAGMAAFEQFLYANRLPIYIGGLIAILIPRGLRTFTSVRLAPETRTVIVVVTLLLMILTYLAERRVRGRDDHGPAAETQPGEYDLTVRIAVGLAVIGVAVGIYLTLEVNTLVGILFIIGSYLFGGMAFRRDRSASRSTDTGLGE